jgi:hypothetical protein
MILTHLTNDSVDLTAGEVTTGQQELYNRHNNKKAKTSHQNSDMDIKQKTINTDLSIITNHNITSLEEGAENIWI